MKHYPLIRTIYLYLFAIIGLVLLVIGGVRFADMGLKTFVFTKAESDYESGRLVMAPCVSSVEKLGGIDSDKSFTEDEKNLIRQWLVEYKKQSEEKVSYVTINRHKNASINMAMILIGLPLYLYHWLLIKKENKEREEA
jgi:hypothetical protein